MTAGGGAGEMEVGQRSGGGAAVRGWMSAVGKEVGDGWRGGWWVVGRERPVGDGIVTRMVVRSRVDLFLFDWAGRGLVRDRVVVTG